MILFLKIPLDKLYLIILTLVINGKTYFLFSSNIPNISDMLDRLTNARWMSSLDLQSGYNQIFLDEDSRKYTAFRTPQGLFEYKVLPFGLARAPGSFQASMQATLW